MLISGFENMECEHSGLGTSATAIKPILIEPIPSPAESSLQFESNSTGEPRINDAPSEDVTSPASLYQMVSVNINGVVKNLTIPFQQAASDLQNVEANQRSDTLEGQVSLSTTLNQMETVAVPLSQMSNMLTNTVSTNSFDNAFAQHRSGPNRTVQETTLTSSTPSMQSLLGKSLQKVCISNTVKEQLLHQTSSGKKVSYQIGPGNNKKTLIFRSENATLMGQLFQQPPQTVTKIVTLDKSGVAKRIVKICPPNNATRNICPINIVPSYTFAKPVPVGPNHAQNTITKVVAPCSGSSVPLSPKAPKIIILSHPPTSAETVPSCGTFPLPASVSNVCQAESSISMPESVSSEKFCSIDSVASLSSDHFDPVGPQSDRPSLQNSVLSSKGILKSLLKFNNDTGLVNCVATSKSTCGSDPLEHCAKVQPGQTTSVGDPSKLKNTKQDQTKYEDNCWEPPPSEFDRMHWSDAGEIPVVRKIHDASVKTNHGDHNKGTPKTKLRPKRRYSMENITSCKMGCIGCKEHVKRVRKKKHQDIYKKLRAKHPELKKCSVVISRLNINIFGKTQVAKKSTTKSGLYMKQSISSTVGRIKGQCLIPCSESDGVNSELEREFKLDQLISSAVNQVDHMKDLSDERVPMNNQISEDQGDQVQDHNLSKSRYLMIKTNAGTFLVPTDSSQSPVVLNGDMLKTAEPTLNLDSSEESKDSCTLNSENFTVKTEGNSSDVTSRNDFSFPECPKGNRKDSKFDSTEGKSAFQFEKPDEKPADRIQRLKERLKMQQQEMENARKLLESSRNVLRSIDD